MKNYIKNNQNYKNYGHFLHVINLNFEADKNFDTNSAECFKKLKLAQDKFFNDSFKEIFKEAKKQSESLLGQLDLVKSKREQETLILALKENKSFEEIAEKIGLETQRTKQVFICAVRRL